MSGQKLDTTILNPMIPYVGTILGTLEPGTMVVLHGFVPKDADRFQIDFQCGSCEKPRSDVAFHFNPRFARSGVIVCNTLQNERWGWEERTYAMPFTKGTQFEVIIFVFHHKFQVSANGKHLLTYKHKIDLGRVDTLGVYGKVAINTIGIVKPTPMAKQGSQPPSLAFSSMNSSQGASQDSLLIEVPYTGGLPCALCPGRTVAVKGEINKNAKRFAIDLKPSGSKNIALHLNPRMKEKVFVRNTYLYESWGEEERQLQEFPFFPDMYFELLIYCEAHQFKVAVNGQHLLEYKHRMKDLPSINEIAINGDIQLYDIRVW